VWSFDGAVVTVAGEFGAAFDANFGPS